MIQSTGRSFDCTCAVAVDGRMTDQPIFDSLINQSDFANDAWRSCHPHVHDDWFSDWLIEWLVDELQKVSCVYVTSDWSFVYSTKWRICADDDNSVVVISNPDQLIYINDRPLHLNPSINHSILGPAELNSGQCNNQTYIHIQTGPDSYVANECFLGSVVIVSSDRLIDWFDESQSLMSDWH